MAIQKTTAVVLKRIPFRETSYILTLYTRDFGKIRAICKGVRNTKGERSSHFEVFNCLEIVFYERKRSEIFLLTESHLLDFFPKIRSNVEYVGWASYLLELLDSAVGMHEPNRGLFQLLVDTLSHFGLHDPYLLVSVFETKLLSNVGYLPDLDRCSVCNSRLNGAFFVLLEGNLVCRSCRKPTMRGKEVSEGARKVLRFVSKQPLNQAWRLQYTPDIFREINSVLFSLAKTRFEHDFQAINFLSEIGVCKEGSQAGLVANR